MHKRVHWSLVSCLVIAAFIVAFFAMAEARTASKGDKPKYGGKIIYAMEEGVSSLDPDVGIGGYNIVAYRRVYDQLIKCDPSLTPRPELSLAESWEFPNPTTWILHLRRGIKFHDGTDFDAEAVKFNIERTKNTRTSIYSRHVRVIDTVDVIDKHTVKFNLKSPWGSCFGVMTSGAGNMKSPTAVKSFGKDYRWNPVGTGAFKFKEVVMDTTITSIKNENYWMKDADGNQLPYLDKVILEIIPDPTTRIAALETGAVDIAGIGASTLERFQKMPKFGIVTGMNGESNHIYWNPGLPPFDDINMRKAIAYALDPAEVNKAVFFGLGQVADGGIWLPGSAFYTKDIPRFHYDLGKAKQYLSKTAYPKGGVKLRWVIVGFPYVMQSAEIYQRQLAKLGIEVELTTFDAATALPNWLADGGKYHNFLTPYGLRPEPDATASSFRRDSNFNVAKYGSKKVEDLIDLGATTYDMKERIKIYKKLQAIAMDELGWQHPLIYSVGHTAYLIKIGGMKSYYDWDARPVFEFLWVKN